MSREDRKPFANEQFGKHLIPPSDSNHSEHERWLRERDEDRRHFQAPGNDRRATPRVKNDAERASSEQTKVVHRTYVLEPRWSICVIDGRVIQPSNEKHTDHELWRKWQMDIAIDTKSDRVMRLHLERVRPHLIDLHAKKIDDLRPLADAQQVKHLKALVEEAALERELPGLIQMWLRLRGRSARIELEAVKKYLGLPIV